MTQKAMELKALGIEVYVIGIANYNKAEISAIASSPNHIFELANFDQLQDLIS